MTANPTAVNRGVAEAELRPRPGTGSDEGATVDPFPPAQLSLRAAWNAIRRRRAGLKAAIGMAEDPEARLEQESGRLRAALGRLETAIRSVGERSSEEASRLRAEREELGSRLTSLNADHAALNRRLDDMQAGHIELERTIDQVAKRLDATIGRLKNVLD